MIDFVGRTTSVVDEAAKWGNYFGEIDNRAQRRWMDREARQRYDEENRYQLDRAQSNRGAYNDRAGLFTGADASFGNMEQRDVPMATPTGPANIAPPTSSGLATEPQGVPTNVTRQPGTGTDQAFRPQHPTNLVTPLTPRDMTREQSRAWFAYVNATRRFNIGSGRMDRPRGGVSNEEIQRHLRNLREVGIELRNGNPVSIRPGHLDPTDPGEYSQFSWPGNLPEGNEPTVDPQADLQSSDQAPSAATSGPGSPFYSGDPDTSGMLQATPEMRMIETVVQDNLRLADVAARHGRNVEAEQHMAQALQAQASLLQQSRLVMLRAGAQGHRTALADLLGLYSGRPAGTTRIAETNDGTNRFHIQVETRNGWTTATANPLTMDELFARAEYLVDREAVAARSEANTEIIRANIAAGADIRVAQINAMSNQQEQIVRAAIANADNQTRERIARGDVDFVVDSTNNVAYLRSYETGPNGEMVPVITRMGEEEVQVPSVDGNRTEQQMVGRRVTGVAGLRTN